MKKKITTLVLGFALILGACKEIPPYIDGGGGAVVLKDTCYVTTNLPAKQDLNILIEDISGVRCVNCPDAAKVAHDIYDDNPGRIVVTTIHPKILKGFTFPHNDIPGYMDFRTDAGTNIVKELIGEPLGLPAGAINRTKFPGETDVAMSERTWKGHVASLLPEKAKVSLDLNVTKDVANNTADAHIKVLFQEKIADPVHLSIFVTESHIENPQSTLNEGTVLDYEHNFIFRSSVTPYFGIELFSEVTTIGSTCEKGFEVPIDTAWDYKNCSIVVVVNRHGDENKEVLQVQTVDLK